MDNPLVQPDPGLFLWTIFTFLVLLGLLARFAWRPLLAMLETRENMIRTALQDAEKAIKHSVIRAGVRQTTGPDMLTIKLTLDDGQ